MTFAARAVSKGRAALFISLVSLAFSGASLYETVLRQPRLTIFAGCNWQYWRGPRLNDEYYVIPITVANDGARGGTVLAIELKVDKGGQSRAHTGNFTVAGDKTRQLFAPLVVAGRSSATASIMFTQQAPSGSPLVDEPGHYEASLAVRTAVGSSYGFIDRLFASPPPEQLHLKILLRRLDITTVLRDPASFDACDLGDLPTAQAK